MRLKDASVKLEGVSWRMFDAAIKVEPIFRRLGAELIITSAKDGKHSAKSLHYEGLALDLRSRNVAGAEKQVLAEMKTALGPDFDVVFEGDHFHIEYDPE